MERNLKVVIVAAVIVVAAGISFFGYQSYKKLKEAKKIMED